MHAANPYNPQTTFLGSQKEKLLLKSLLLKQLHRAIPHSMEYINGYKWCKHISLFTSLRQRTFFHIKYYRCRATHNLYHCSLKDYSHNLTRCLSARHRDEPVISLYDTFCEHYDRRENTFHNPYRYDLFL